MNWKDISVFQWQQLTELQSSISKEDTELDVSVRAAAICTGMTENQIDSLPEKKLQDIIKTIGFVYSEQLKSEPVKFIKVKGKRYRCVYDIRDMRCARYIEAKHFMKDVNLNLHKIAASMVVPQKRTWFGRWVDDEYDARKHSEYAEDLQSASVVNVLGSVVFFYHVFRLSIKNLRGYLIYQMMTEQKISQNQATWVWENLCSSLDGYTKHPLLQNISESRLTKYMRSRQLNS